MSRSSQTQAAAWRMRRSTRSRFYIGQATPWAAGLVVTAGAVVQASRLGWTAQNAGTTAGVPPDNNNGALFVDGGGVRWVHTPLLLTPPTPIS
jgi:hypothetical protein